jgi:hypothetical protein
MKFKLTKNLNVRDYGDILILLPLGERAIFLEGIAINIFKLIKRNKSLNDIYKILLKRYKIQKEELDKNTTFIINKLISLKILKKINNENRNRKKIL